MSIILVWGILKIHTYPEKIAKQKNHPQTKAISVTAILGLLVFPLWMFALIWAYSNAVIGTLYNNGEKEKQPSKQSKPKEVVDTSSITDEGASKKLNINYGNYSHDSLLFFLYIRLMSISCNTCYN